jgi:hypothetical protein
MKVCWPWRVSCAHECGKSPDLRVSSCFGTLPFRQMNMETACIKKAQMTLRKAWHVR